MGHDCVDCGGLKKSSPFVNRSEDITADFIKSANKNKHWRKKLCKTSMNRANEIHNKRPMKWIILNTIEERRK